VVVFNVSVLCRQQEIPEEVVSRRAQGLAVEFLNHHDAKELALSLKVRLLSWQRNTCCALYDVEDELGGSASNPYSKQLVLWSWNFCDCIRAYALHIQVALQRRPQDVFAGGF
jgi:hypothetical protein